MCLETAEDEGDFMFGCFCFTAPQVLAQRTVGFRAAP